MIRKEIFDVIHKTIYQFIDDEGNEEVPMSDKDKLLLEVNKAICNNLKALEQEPVLDEMTYEEKSAIVIKQLREDRDRLLDAFNNIRAEIENSAFDDVNGSKFISVNRVNQILVLVMSM